MEELSIWRQKRVRQATMHAHWVQKLPALPNRLRRQWLEFCDPFGGVVAMQRLTAAHNALSLFISEIRLHSVTHIKRRIV